MITVCNVSIIENNFIIGWKSTETYEKIKPYYGDTYRIVENLSDFSQDELDVVNNIKFLVSDQSYKQITIMVDVNLVLFNYDDITKNTMKQNVDLTNIVNLCLNKINDYIIKMQ
ncbi:MAG: hypothetical protein HPY57_13790 [Ignavibacteria bacterium]|nr:hypothetical protein [Ignavibacteria bacterium]